MYPKRTIKYWITQFDNSEQTKSNPRAPKFRVIIRDAVTREEFEGKLFLKKSKGGELYLGGEIYEKEEENIDTDRFDLQKMSQEIDSEDNNPNSDTKDSAPSNEGPISSNNDVKDSSPPNEDPASSNNDDDKKCPF